MVEAVGNGKSNAPDAQFEALLRGRGPIRNNPNINRIMAMRIYFYANSTTQNYQNILTFLNKFDPKLAKTFEKTISKLQSDANKHFGKAPSEEAKAKLEQSLEFVRNTARLFACQLAFSDVASRQRLMGQFNTLAKLNSFAAIYYVSGLGEKSGIASALSAINTEVENAKPKQAGTDPKKAIPPEQYDAILHKWAGGFDGLAKNLAAAVNASGLPQKESGFLPSTQRKELAATVMTTLEKLNGFVSFAKKDLCGKYDEEHKKWVTEPTNQATKEVVRAIAQNGLHAKLELSLSVEVQSAFALRFVDLLSKNSDVRKEAVRVLADANTFMSNGPADGLGYIRGAGWLRETLKSIQSQVDAGANQLFSLCNDTTMSYNGKDTIGKLMTNLIADTLLTSDPVHSYSNYQEALYAMFFKDIFGRKEGASLSTWRFERFVKSETGGKELLKPFESAELAKVVDALSAAHPGDAASLLNASSVQYKVANPVQAAQATLRALETIYREADDAFKRAEITDPQAVQSLGGDYPAKYSVLQDVRAKTYDFVKLQVADRIGQLRNKQLDGVCAPNATFNAKYISPAFEKLFYTPYDAIERDLTSLVEHSPAWASTLLGEKVKGTDSRDLFVKSARMLLGGPDVLVLLQSQGGVNPTGAGTAAPGFIYSKSDAEYRMVGDDPYVRVKNTVWADPFMPIAGREQVIINMAPRPDSRAAIAQVNGSLTIAPGLVNPDVKTIAPMTQFMPGQTFELRFAVVGSAEFKLPSDGRKLEVGGSTFPATLTATVAQRSADGRSIPPNSFAVTLHATVRKDSLSGPNFLVYEMTTNDEIGQVKSLVNPYTVSIVIPGSQISLLETAKVRVSAPAADEEKFPGYAFSVAPVGGYDINASPGAQAISEKLQLTADTTAATNRRIGAIPLQLGSNSIAVSGTLVATIREGEKNEEHVAVTGAANANYFRPELLRMVLPLGREKLSEPAPVEREPAPVEQPKQVVFQLAPTDITQAKGNAPVITTTTVSASGQTMSQDVAAISLADGVLPGNLGEYLNSKTGGVRLAANLEPKQSSLTGAMKDPAKFSDFMADLRDPKKQDPVLILATLNKYMDISKTNLNLGEGEQVLLSSKFEQTDVGRYLFSGVVVGRFEGRLGVQRIDNKVITTDTTITAGEIGTRSSLSQSTKYSPLGIFSYRLTGEGPNRLDLYTLFAKSATEISLIKTMGGTSIYLTKASGLNDGMSVGAMQKVGEIKEMPIAISAATGFGGQSVSASLSVDGNTWFYSSTRGIRPDNYGMIATGLEWVARVIKPKKSEDPMQAVRSDDALSLPLRAFNETSTFSKGKYGGVGKLAEMHDGQPNQIMRGIYDVHILLQDATARKIFMERLGTITQTGFNDKNNTLPMPVGGVQISVTAEEMVAAAQKFNYDSKFGNALSAADMKTVREFLVKVGTSTGNYGYLASGVQFYQSASKGEISEGLQKMRDTHSLEGVNKALIGTNAAIDPAIGVYFILGNEAAKAYNKLVLAEIAAQQVQAPSASEATPPPTQVPREAAPATVEGMPPVASSMTQFTPSAQPVNTLLENYVELPDVPGNVAKKADILASLVLGFNSLGANEPGLGSNMIMGGMSAAVYDKQSTYVFAGEAVTPLTITPEVARATAERLKTLNREDPRIKPDLDLLDAITQLDAIK
ncbi:hypothetical protein AUJ13_06020 [Candidatus Micrarchaeota archaeon CG1_02_49_24]|nr:MAG: hypothetical protein AUJ13_06020 [Candidatus Micrarchaeota archaeon CG1_02_49_24]HII54190.1 hypothetical protein [Candidatus Micrarchaeota archaeon]